MARPLPIEYPGAFYHVTARGHERKVSFVDDPDRQTRTRRAKADYRRTAMKYLHEKSALTQQRIGGLLELRSGSAVSLSLRDLTRQASQETSWDRAMRPVLKKLSIFV